MLHTQSEYCFPHLSSQMGGYQIPRNREFFPSSNQECCSICEFFNTWHTRKNQKLQQTDRGICISSAAPGNQTHLRLLMHLHWSVWAPAGACIGWDNWEAARVMWACSGVIGIDLAVFSADISAPRDLEALVLERNTRTKKKRTPWEYFIWQKYRVDINVHRAVYMKQWLTAGKGQIRSVTVRFQGVRGCMVELEQIVISGCRTMSVICEPRCSSMSRSNKTIDKKGKPSSGNLFLSTGIYGQILSHMIEVNKHGYHWRLTSRDTFTYLFISPGEKPRYCSSSLQIIS